MELEEMKKMWQQYDAALQQNKLLNEQLLLNMLKDKSQNAANRILRYEYIGAAICIILAVLYIAMFNTAFTNTGMTICYFISLLWILAGIALFYIKYNMLSSLHFGESSITHTAATIERFRLLVVKERIWSLWLSPMLIFTVFVVIMQWVRHEDVFANINDYLVRIITGSVAAIIALVFVYRALYFKSIQEIKSNLEEIEKFRQ